MAINSRSLGSASAYSTGTVAIDSTGSIVTLTGGLFTNRWGQGDSLIVKPSNPFNSGFSNGFSRQVLGIVAQRTSPTRLVLSNSLTSLTGQSGLSYKIQRSYSTFNTWLIGQAGNYDFVVDQRIEKAVVYSDGTVYDESITLPQTNTSSLYYWWIYVPKSQRHNGSVSGTGATLNWSGNASYTYPLTIGLDHFTKANYTIIDGMKFVRNANNWPYGYTLGLYSNNCEVKNCLFHCPSGAGTTGTGGSLISFGSGYVGWSNANYFHDNIIVSDSTTFEYGLTYSFAWVTDNNKIYNNTVYGSYTVAAMSLSDSNGATLAYIKNNYVCNIGAGVDYQFLNSYSSSFSGFAYNGSDDGSAGTANNNKTISLSARKFINTAASSQLLYILSDSSLLNAGIGPRSDSNVASTSIDWSSRTGSSARIGAAQWQLIIGSTIGTSAVRDFSTINSWLAACPTDLTAVQHQWVGYCYNDSQFVESVTFAGITTSPTYSVVLTAPVGQRHSGKAGTGVSIKPPSPANLLTVNISNLTLQYLQLTGWQKRSANYVGINMDNAGTDCIIRNNLMYDNVSTFLGSYIHILNAQRLKIYRNIFYSSSNGSLPAHCIWDVGYQSVKAKIYNNTFYRISDAVFQQGGRGSTAGQFKNNILIDGPIINNWSSLVVSNNLSSASSMQGTNNILNASGSATFVSTATASTFDLRLLSSSVSAIGMGINLGTPYNVDITGYASNTAFAWDIGSHQFTIMSTVGSSAGRDFSTATSWEAACPLNITTSGTNHIWRGETFKDSDFNEYVIIQGTESDSNHYTILTAAIGHRHTGKAGTGVKFKYNGTLPYPTASCVIALAQKYCIVEFIEVDMSLVYGTYSSGIGIYNAGIGSTGILRNCIVHDMGNKITAGGGLIIVSVGYAYAHVYNNIVYNAGNSSQGQAQHGITVPDNGYGTISIYNNTVYNCKGKCFILGNPTGTGSTVSNIKNNLCMSGAQGDYSNFGTYNHDYNMSSDNTVSAEPNGLPNKTISSQFVSIVSGSEDLHIKVGSDAIKKGTNLGSTNNVNIDINGFNRTSAAYKWDIGAYQYTQTLFKLLRGPLFLLLKGSDAV